MSGKSVDVVVCPFATFRRPFDLHAMLKTEKRAAFSLSLIYAFRMIGLFMILPVFSLYANDYAGATPLLIGLAIGIYGLTQGLFQLPFGFLSDRFGRKRMILLGLVLFCLMLCVFCNCCRHLY